MIGAINAEALSAELRIPEAERKLKAKAAPSGQICISVRLVRDDVHTAPPNWTPLEAATFYMDSGRYDTKRVIYNIQCSEIYVLTTLRNETFHRVR